MSHFTYTQGDAMTTKTRKRIVQIAVTDDNSTVVDVDAKECAGCDAVKALTEFSVNKPGLGGRLSLCRACISVRGRIRYEKDANMSGRVAGTCKRVSIVQIAGVDAKKCTGCNTVKALTDFPARKKGSGERISRCRACVSAYNRIRAKNVVAMSGKVARSHKLRTPESYRVEVAESTNGDYTVIGDFIGVDKPIPHRHSDCSHDWNVSPANFLNKGNRCPKCAGLHRRTPDEYMAEVEALTCGEYNVLGAYLNAVTPITHRHNAECGHEWSASPNNFLAGSRCPRCNESKGERRVSEVLDAMSVSYVIQYTFDDCRAKLPLPFDHAVFTTSGLVVIEYDGVHHFQPVVYSGNELEAIRKFKYRQRNDRIKTEYCASRGIPLIRINYTQFDEIETILRHELTRLGVIKFAA